MKKPQEIKRKEDDNILLIWNLKLYFLNYFARKAQTSHLETT